MSKKSKTTGGFKHPLVYLWALLPVGSAALSYLLYAVDTRVWILLRPVFEFSIVGFLCVAGMMFLTGFAGYRFARAGVGALPAALIGNAVPIVCTLAFLILAIAGRGESDASMFLCLFGGGVVLDGVGLLTGISGAHGDFEVYITLALIIAVFIVGYSLGASGAAKNKK